MLGWIEERNRRRTEAQARARRALVIDMLKSYAGPIVLVAFVDPFLSPAGRFGGANYALLLIGLVMIGLALILVQAKE